jgi:heme/copper-type cytochrome/quinol oxidase subunit 2
VNRWYCCTSTAGALENTIKGTSRTHVSLCLSVCLFVVVVIVVVVVVAGRLSANQHIVQKRKTSTTTKHMKQQNKDLTIALVLVHIVVLLFYSHPQPDINKQIRANGAKQHDSGKNSMRVGYMLHDSSF